MKRTQVFDDNFDKQFPALTQSDIYQLQQAELRRSRHTVQSRHIFQPQNCTSSTILKQYQSHSSIESPIRALSTTSLKDPIPQLIDATQHANRGIKGIGASSFKIAAQKYQNTIDDARSSHNQMSQMSDNFVQKMVAAKLRRDYQQSTSNHLLSSDISPELRYSYRSDLSDQVDTEIDRAIPQNTRNSLMKNSSLPSLSLNKNSTKQFQSKQDQLLGSSPLHQTYNVLKKESRSFNTNFSQHKYPKNKDLNEISFNEQFNDSDKLSKDKNDSSENSSSPTKLKTALRRMGIRQNESKNVHRKIIVNRTAVEALEVKKKDTEFISPIQYQINESQQKPETTPIEDEISEIKCKKIVKLKKFKKKMIEEKPLKKDKPTSMIEIYEQLKKEGFFSVSTKFKPPPEYFPSRSSDSISFTNNSKQTNEKNSKKEVQNLEPINYKQSRNKMMQSYDTMTNLENKSLSKSINNQSRSIEQSQLPDDSKKHQVKPSEVQEESLYRKSLINKLKQRVVTRDN